MDGPLPGEKGTLAEDKVETPQLRRRIRINMEDEEVIRQLPGMTFIEARRICMERPFQDQWELLKVRGLSQETLQRWEAGDSILSPFRDVIFFLYTLNFRTAGGARNDLSHPPNPDLLPVTSRKDCH